MASLSEIISAVVDDNSTANDALSSNQLDELVCHGALSIALSISLEVAQVTNVTVVIGRCTMLLVLWVKVRTSRSAAVGVVAKGMDVHATLSVGIVAGYVP